MEIDETTRRYNEIFQPGLIDESLKVAATGQRFVYYTSADTAVSILRNARLWFRNATVMNDFSEIGYGLSLVQAVFSGDEGKRFRDAVDDIFPETIEKAEGLIASWEREWRFETYLACVSVHDADEDTNGRLSMWRAYGNTALVVKNTPMMAVTDLLAVYSMPVRYLSEAGLQVFLSKVTDEIIKNKKYLQGLGQETVVGYIHGMLFSLAISTKHPGFAEEKEWRLYYCPSVQTSPAMEPEVVVLNGVPQKVFKLKLAHDPSQGLFEADIPSLIDRVIIGPTEYPYVSFQAFVSLLDDLGVKDPASKVFVSGTPLRVKP